MDVEAACKLRESRAHRRAQIADRWRRRVMRDLKRREIEKKNQKEAPQRTRTMGLDTRTGDGTAADVQWVHGSPTTRERAVTTSKDNEKMQPEESSDDEWHDVMQQMFQD